ncbi:LytR C-terminal domain-containing protein [Kitasatospora arboriphila]
MLWDAKAAKALFDTVRQGKPLTGHAAPAPSASPVAATEAPAAAGTVPAGQIRVQVLNGTGLTGLGFRVDEELRRAGFATTGTPSNADTVTTRTAVRYDPRWDESAKTLAAALPGAELVPVPGLGATLQVVVGGDYRGPASPSGAPSAPGPAAAPASPSTSAPSSASPGPAVAAETGSEISCG